VFAKGNIALAEKFAAFDKRLLRAQTGSHMTFKIGDAV
jgi:hypothetical protein